MHRVQRTLLLQDDRQALADEARLALDRSLGEELDVDSVVTVLEAAGLRLRVALEREARAADIELVWRRQVP